MDGHHTAVSIRGLVVVVQRDHRSRIRALGLRCGDGEVLRVEDTPMAELLRDYLDCEVVAHGVLHTDERGARRIRVRGFEPGPAGRSKQPPAPLPPAHSSGSAPRHPR